MRNILQCSNLSPCVSVAPATLEASPASSLSIRSASSMSLIQFATCDHINNATVYIFYTKHTCVKVRTFSSSGVKTTPARLASIFMPSTVMGLPCSSFLLEMASSPRIALTSLQKVLMHAR